MAGERLTLYARVDPPQGGHVLIPIRIDPGVNVRPQDLIGARFNVKLPTPAGDVLCEGVIEEVEVK